jgi:hypothetical protein
MRSIPGGLAWTLVGVLAFGCAKRAMIYAFEPPPVGAAYTRRDVEVHHQLSEALIECQRELDARSDEDRRGAWKRRILVLLASLVAGLGSARGGSSVASDRPCDLERMYEARCRLQGGFLVHIGPSLSPEGEREDDPRAGLDLRADIDAALVRLDELLEEPELEVDRDEVLAAIAQLRAECTTNPSPLSADPAPATLAP